MERQYRSKRVMTGFYFCSVLIKIKRQIGLNEPTFLSVRIHSGTAREAVPSTHVCSNLPIKRGFRRSNRNGKIPASRSVDSQRSGAPGGRTKHSIFLISMEFHQLHVAPLKSIELHWTEMGSEAPETREKRDQISF